MRFLIYWAYTAGEDITYNSKDVEAAWHFKGQVKNMSRTHNIGKIYMEKVIQVNAASFEDESSKHLQTLWRAIFFLNVNKFHVHALFKFLYNLHLEMMASQNFNFNSLVMSLTLFWGYIC